MAEAVAGGKESMVPAVSLSSSPDRQQELEMLLCAPAEVVGEQQDS